MSNPVPVARRSRGFFRRGRLLLAGLLATLIAGGTVRAGSPSGYTEYLIPFDEDVFVYVTDPLVNVNPIPAASTTQAVVSLTIWSDSTTIYYDHWEDGYELDPENPDAAFDEKFTGQLGSTLNFISSAIPRPRTDGTGNTYIGSAGDCTAQAAPSGTGIATVTRNTTNYCYDGRDYIVVVGGASTMTRGGLINGSDLNQKAAIMEEVYPLAPQLIKYILPTGDGSPTGTTYERVIAVIQATEDNTELRIDFDADGTYDAFSTENGYRTARNAGTDATVITLNKGETYILDEDSNGDLGDADLPKGAIILGSKTLQVEYFYGQEDSGYDTRAIAAYPRGFWGKSYYAPADGDPGGQDTEIVLYNPSLTDNLTINWRTTSASGSFTMTPEETALFSAKTGSYVPDGSAVYLTGSNTFWGFSDIDVNSTAYDWGYSLMPDNLLKDEQVVAYAPGAIPQVACNATDGRAAGLFVTPVFDDTVFFIDKNADDIPDSSLTGGASPGSAPYDDSIQVLIGATAQTPNSSGGFTADRLQSLYITGSNSGDLVSSTCDLTGARIWATGPFTMAYGENPGTATTTGGPDLGYTVLPNPGDWMDLVLTVDKATNPVVLSTTSGATATYTLVIKSFDYEVDDVVAVDTLPANWAFVDNSTTITLPDLTTISGDSADPTPSGQTLTWDQTLLGSLEPNQQITIEFQAQTTADFANDALTRNLIEVTGSRTVGAVTQTFKTRDFVFNTYRDTTTGLQITKASSVPEPTPVSPGDTLTYTVTVTNPDTSTAPLSNLWISDVIPAGVTYVASSGEIAGCYRPFSDDVLDNFGAAAYNNNNGSANWATSWSETDPYGNAATGAGSGLVLITGGQLRLRYQSMTAADNFDAAATNGYANSTGTNSWSGSWTETGDDGSRATGIITADTGGGGGNNRANFGPATTSTTRALSRTVPVAGTSATISFTLSNQGNDANEGVIAEYDLGLGGGFVEIQRITNNTLTGTNPLTVDTTGASTLTIRFRMFDTGNNTFEAGDNVGLDNVNIAFNNAVGSQIVRTVDLTGATNPILTFTTATSGTLDGTDEYVVEAATNPAGPFTELALATDDAAFIPAIGAGYDLTNYISATTAVRFRIKAGYDATDEYRDVDAVRVTYDGLSLLAPFASGEPPDFLAGGSATDSFNTAGSGSGSNGTRAWATNWDDAGDDGNLATGDIEIVNGRIEFQSSTDGGEWIRRSATVTGASEVQLGYEFTDSDVEAGEGFTVQWSNDGSTWTTVNTLDGADASGTYSHTIAWDPSDTTFWVRFVGLGAYSAANDNAWIDNVAVSVGSGCSVPVDSSVTLTFDVTVDNPFPTGQTDIVNTAWSAADEIPIPQEASARNIVIAPSSTGATVGDRVWLDIDGDGLLDPGEAGIPGVEVTLKDQWGTPLMVTTTDSQGRYLFIDVVPGDDYFVEITDGLPPGLTQTTDSRTDERTNDFDLSAGENYLDADLGFRASTGLAVIGDTVWVDVDGDQFQDPGEVGITGVEVRLYLDVDGDGVPEPGAADGSPIDTEVTVAGGKYLFTNITANGTNDYFVTLDVSQTALTGYTNTTLMLFYYADLPSQATRVDADFGFNATASGTLFSISDRVWLDDGASGGTADNGLQEGGEAGIPGVTVSLLDQGGAIIATTTTDANGDFTFPGVPGGVNYTWRVTDNDHVLADLYGTTTSALAGQYQMTGPLTTNLDYTTAPHFGYNSTRSVGDTVWNDIDGSGAQDDGEPGIGGVTVLLYRDVDNDGDFEPGGADGAPIATLVTSPTGYYLFSGLANGSYWVSIDETQAALTSYDDHTTDDDDMTAAPGHQRLATVAGGASDLDNDFGYRVTTAYSIAGRLWNDADNDGVDDSEPGFKDVTLELVDATDTVIATTSTGSTGSYSFDGLPAGTYTVRFTDVNGVVTGYQTTYEKTEGGLAASYNGRESVTVGASKTDIDFGFYNPFRSLTLAVVSSFRAFDDSGSVVIEWKTSAEIGTIGFDLLRFDPAEKRYVRLNEELLPALIGNRQGGTYSFLDEGAVVGETYRYRLVEVEASGRRNKMGPYVVSTDDTAFEERREEPSGHRPRRFEHEPRVSKQQRWDRGRLVQGRAWREADVQRGPGHGRRPAPDASQVKVVVSGAGLHYVPFADIAAAGLEGAATSRRLRLTRGGVEAAFTPSEDGSGLYFYAPAFDSPYSNDDVYWLSEVRGRADGMDTRRDRRARPTGLETFRRSVHAEQDLMPSPHLFTDPAADWSLWNYAFGGWGATAFPFRAEGATGSGEAAVTVRLHGGNDTEVNPDHHVVVRVNGTTVGEVYWDGTRPSVSTHVFDASVLVDGDNTLEIQAMADTGAWYSLVYLDSFDVSYDSAYRATGNRLTCSTGENPAIRITGFTRSDVMVFDVTSPAQPVRVLAEPTLQPDGSYGVALGAPRPNTVYHALTPDAALGGRLLADQPSSLRARDNAAEYVIVTTADMKATAQTLADYRGMSSMVVDIEDVYDEFGAGVESPQALKNFLTHAWSRWAVRPRYVVLAGDGSWDYKNAYGYGDNLIPPAMVSTPDGLASSDVWYADVDPTTAAPEIALGRLPVSNAAELEGVIRKIQNREGLGGDWLRKVLAVADNPDTVGPFPTDSDRLMSLASPDATVDKVYLPALTAAQARTRLVAALNEGRGMVSYVGHAGYDTLADEGILNAGHVAGLVNAERPTVLTAMTCVAGDFAIPFVDAIASQLVRVPGGGAAAVWAPTSMSENEHAVALAEGYYSAVFGPEPVRIGDAILAAMQSYDQTWRPKHVLRVYGLLGDPAMPIARQ